MYRTSRTQPLERVCTGVYGRFKVIEGLHMEDRSGTGTRDLVRCITVELK